MLFVFPFSVYLDFLSCSLVLTSSIGSVASSFSLICLEWIEPRVDKFPCS
jgi:hypothetical protein